jgi:hypothetical protein
MRTQIRIPGDAPLDARDVQASVVARVKSLEAEIQRMSELLASMQGEEGDDERKGRVISDAAWKCKKCSSLLGFYDVATDVLRIRYKEHSAYIRVGQGGFVQLICRGCGDINTQEYQTPEEVEDAQRRAPSTRRAPK